MRLLTQTVAILLSTATLISALPVDKVKHIPYLLYVCAYQCRLELMKISVTGFNNERNSILSQTLAVSRLRTKEKSCILSRTLAASRLRTRGKSCILSQTLAASRLRTRGKSCILSQTLAVSRLRTSARNYTLLLILDASKLRINKRSAIHVSCVDR
jgi:hypothetical protein